MNTRFKFNSKGLSSFKSPFSQKTCLHYNDESISLFWGIIAIYSQKHIKNINTLCRQNEDHVKGGGTYGNHCPVAASMVFLKLAVILSLLLLRIYKKTFRLNALKCQLLHVSLSS
jgi:hypothetical protein